MRMNRMAALTLSAGLITMAACSDSPTAPTKAKQMGLGGPSLAAGTTSTDISANFTELKICKVGNASGTFTVTDVGNGAGTGNPTFATDEDGATAGTQITLTPGTDEAPNCIIAVEDLGDSQQDFGDFFSVTESVGSGVTTEVTCYFAGSGEVPCPDPLTGLYVNTAHGWTLVFRNTEETSEGCTYTKGWYQSKNATITGVDGLSIETEKAFFAATPNKTGSVSFVGPNNLLNLYQQYLAALENGGAGGPSEVQDAIDDVANGTTVDGTGKLTTTLTSTEISALIVTLSAFNEGTLKGWPHC